MSTQSEITRIQTARDTIRAKAVELGIGTSTDKLDALATKFETNLTNQGAVSATVKEGETYTIPKGYHNESGTVQGVAGGGSYTLQTKSVTPTKSQQNITSDDGYYGLSSVTVEAIPAQYQDVSGTTATAADVLVTKTFTATDGTLTAGTMANNGKVTQTLSTTKTSYTIPQGYHSGTGTVSITTEEKTATPTKSTQTITPSTGKVLSKVTVNAIPSNYLDTSGVTATADKVLTGSKVIGLDEDGAAATIDGAMANNGAVALTMDGLSVTSVTVPAGYHSGAGTVSLTNDIENALAAI